MLDNSKLNYWIKTIRLWQKRPQLMKNESVIVAEGEHLIIEAVKANFHLLTVFGKKALNQSAVEIQEYFVTKKDSAEYFECSEQKIKSISTLANPSMIAVFSRLPKMGLIDNINICDDIIILDSLQDAGNVGTIMRVARALGHRQIISMVGGISLWHPKVLRAAQGAHFSQLIIEDVNFDELYKIVQKSESPQIYIADMHGKEMFSESLQNKGIWIFGNEGQGVNPKLFDLAHQKVSIPMPSGFESLNVGLSAGILLYEQFRQRNY